MTPEQHERKLASQRKYREKNKEQILQKHREYNAINADLVRERNRICAERKRRLAGVPIRPPVMTDEERQSKIRERNRLAAETKRRSLGVPERIKYTEEQKQQARDLKKVRDRNVLRKLRAINPDICRDRNRTHMTKRRLADELGVSIAEVPNDLFIAKCLILDVTRKVKELSK